MKSRLRGAICVHPITFLSCFMRTRLDGVATIGLLRALTIPFALCLSSAVVAGNDVEIVSGSTLVNMDPNHVSTNDDAVIGIDNLLPNNITLRKVTTGSGGTNTQQGNITLTGDIDFNRSNATHQNTLELNALNDIILNGRAYDGLGFNDKFTLTLNPDIDAAGGGSVYLNSSIGDGLSTYVNGSLVITSTGAYTLDRYTDVLSADSIDNTQGGGFTFTAGALTLKNSGLTLDSGGLLGDTLNLSSAQALNLENNNVLTVGSSGSLSLNGGRLTVGQLDNSAGGAVSFSSGYLTLSNSGLAVGTGGLLGDTVSVDSASAINISGALTIDASGTVNLNGNSGGGSLTVGSIDNSGGTFNFNGGALTLTASDLSIGSAGPLGSNVALGTGKILNVNNHQVVVDAGSSLNLQGGALSAGSIDNSAGGSFTFDSGDLRLTNSNLTVGSSGLLSNLSLTAGKSLVVANNNQLVIGTGSAVDVSGGSLEVGSIDTSSGGSFAFSSGSLTLTNSGLSVDESGMLGDTLAVSNGKTLQVNALTVGNGTGTTDTVNQTGGSIRVTSPGSVLVDTDGVYNISGGWLEIGAATGSNVTVNGTFSQTGGIVTGRTSPSGGLTGIPLVLGAGGLYELNGGTLAASSIDRSAGGSFVFTSGSLGTDSISVDSTGLLGNSINLTPDKSVLTNSLVMGATGSVVIDGGRLTADSIDNSAGGTFSYLGGILETNNSISVGSGGLLGSTVTLGASDSLTLGGLSIGNGGTLTLNGGEILAPYMNRSGSGVLNFNSGYIQMGSQLVVSSGGLLGSNVTLGSGQTLGADNVDIASGSSMTLSGGSLTASSITGAGSFSFTSGSLSLFNQSLTIGTGGLLGQNLLLSANQQLGVSVAVAVAADGTLNIRDTSLRGGSISNENTIGLHGNGTIQAVAMVNDGRVTLNDNSGLYLTAGLAENNGRVTIDTNASATISDSSNPGGAEYIQNAGYTVVNGSLNVDGVIDINGGTLGGSGVINADLVINPDGTLSPGNSPGAIHVNGNFTLASGGAVLMQVASDGTGGYLFDQLFVNGTMDLQGGQIRFQLLDGVDETIFQNDFTIGDFFQAGVAGSSTGITDPLVFSNVQLLANNGSNWFDISVAPDGSISTSPTTAPVPVPAAFWLFGSGLVGLTGMAKRKRAS